LLILRQSVQILELLDRLMVLNLSTTFCSLEWQTERTSLMRLCYGKYSYFSFHLSCIETLQHYCCALAVCWLEQGWASTWIQGCYCFVEQHWVLTGPYILLQARSYGSANWDWTARWERAVPDPEHPF
jgi:hypothetical protein